MDPAGAFLTAVGTADRASRPVDKAAPQGAINFMNFKRLRRNFKNLINSI